jgi:spermidine synthase
MVSRRRLLVGLYAASGAAALIYEVTWTRLLTLQLGHTVAAASTVLAAFMGGLAVGAWMAGRAADRIAASGDAQTRRLRLYASLEIVVAVAALLLPVGLAASEPVLRWAYADGTAPAQFAIVRIALSVLLLGMPAAAMGATFPIAAEWFTKTATGTRLRTRGTGLRSERGEPSPVHSPTAPDPTAADAGVLYAANTAGAALGAVAAGFWLIPLLGIRGTTWTGVALNVLAAAGAFWLSALPASAAFDVRIAKPDSEERSPRTVRNKSARSPHTAPVPVPMPAASPVLACAMAAISGFAALVYEVVWTRLLALVIGPTTYAFATMAASFIAGLAIGSAAGSRIARRSAQPAAWLGAMLTLCAVAAALAAWFAASRLPLMVAAEVTNPDAVFGRVVLGQAVGVAVLLLPMTFALGAVFPLALAVASAGAADIGRDTARVYTSNTLGAIVGALAAGFLLVPRLGLRSTVQATAILGVLCGAACLFVARRGTATVTRTPAALWSAAMAAVVVAALASLPRWDHELLASGAYKYAPYLESRDLDTVLRAGRLEYYREGAAGTVSVRRLAGTLSLAIDGKVDASNAGDMLTQRLLGLLPVLLHRDPEDICVIGLGSGVTVGSALSAGVVRHADVIEISPEVVEASAFFAAENNNALRSPAVRLIVGDGRSHLLLTPRSYDVIVSEPSNPWMAGVAALFTREFFEAARARLKPDGLICQWAHTYDISARDLQSIVRTFATVFPQGTMWLVGESDLLLIGTRAAAIAPSLARLGSEWRRGGAPAALSDVGIAGDGTPFALYSLFAGGPAELIQYAGNAPVQTDDRMALEFSAPRGIYGRMTNENGAAIRALGVESAPAAVQTAFRNASDADWTTRGTMELKGEAYAAAFDAFHRAVTMNRHNADALSGLSLAAAGARKADDEREWLESLAAADPANVPVRLELSRLRASAGDYDAAIALATEARRLAPDDARAAEQLASIFADAGDADRLEPLADTLVARYPARPDSRYYRATALFLKGRAQEAAVEARRLVTEHPRHARGFNLLGAACATDGQRDCARTAFDTSIRLDPRDPSAYVNRGLFLLQTGNPAASAASFAEAIAIDPTSTPARDGLTQARQAIAKP